MKLKNWSMAFCKDDGYENRNRIVCAFTDFLKGKQSVVHFSGSCRLVGAIYGCADYVPGEELITPEIISIERTNLTSSRDAIFRANTKKNGIYYCVRLGDAAEAMSLMLDDFNRHRLNPQPGYYRNTANARCASIFL